MTVDLTFKISTVCPHSVHLFLAFRAVIFRGFANSRGLPKNKNILLKHFSG